MYKEGKEDGVFGVLILCVFSYSGTITRSYNIESSSIFNTIQMVIEKMYKSDITCTLKIPYGDSLHLIPKELVSKSTLQLIKH